MTSGLTAERATTLIATIATPKVRMSARGGAQHRSTAVLKEVQGDHAIVQPHGHRRTERVPLSTLTEWKSANETGHRKTATPQRGQPRLPFQHNSSKTTTQYVVFSRKQKGMFGGTKRRWTTSPQFCVEYATEGGAKRSASKLRKNEESDDAEVMTLVAGRQLAIDLAKEEPAEASQESTGPRFPFEDFGADLLDPTIASIMTLDFERMKSLDASRFTTAMDKRTKAIGELLEVQQMMADCIQSVREADAEVKEAARAVLVTEDIDIAEASAVAGKTVTAKSVVRSVLLEEPNSLFKKHLVTKVVDTGISKAKSPRTSVGVAINKMIEDGEIKVNSNNTLCWVGDGA